MLAWKVDYVLPDDAAKPEIDLDYDYWDPKVEGDAFSKRRLNSAKVASRPTLDSGTGGFMLILKPNAKTPPDQIGSYFDLDSWVLLTIRFNQD